MLGTGKGKKIWLMHPKNNKIQGWFKYVKTIKKNIDGNVIEVPNTYENVSEKIAEYIAIEIGIKNAHIDIGTYKGAKGCLSYNILKNNQTMEEGVSLITQKYPFYNLQTMYDEKSQTYYSLSLILNSLGDENLKRSFFKVLIFDYIIGNSDRHQNNWAIIKENNQIDIAPLYDNGSSLCSLILEEDINSYIDTNDTLRMNSLVVTKSRSIVRLDGKSKSKPKHIEVIQYLKEHYYNETKDFVFYIIKKLNEHKINEILEKIDCISYKRKKLISIFLNKKVNDLKVIYIK
jgi:hypothetical protein